MSQPGPVLSGVARATITPPVGIRMMGYTVQPCASERVERDLTATALVLGDGQQRVVVLACDLLFVQAPHADRLREAIGSRLGLAPRHVLIHCSHTHLGPMLPGWDDPPPEEARRQQRYLDHLEELLCGAAAQAAACMQPARLAVIEGRVALGINRRERLPDGRVVIGENPHGAVDHTLGVVRIDRLDGRPLAVVMIAACHPVVLGPRSNCISPDFVGPARELVEQASGATALFLQGAAANVNPVCGIGQGGPEQFEDQVRLGTMLAGETLRCWAQLNTHRRRGAREIVQSVAPISTWRYEPMPQAGTPALAVREEVRLLPLGELPSLADAEKQRQQYQAAYDEAVAAGQPLGAQRVAARLARWAGIVRDAAAAGVRPVTRPLHVWALRINDLALVAVNGEPFAELGLEVRARSPLPHTFLLGYSNGCLGYFPTPEAFSEGGMEVVESYRNYCLPAPFTPQWGPAIVTTALALLQGLARA